MAGQRLSPRTVAATCGLLVALTLAAFWPVLQNGFTNYDDDTYVTENRFVQRGIDGESLRWAFTTSRAANWHPLTWLSHMLDWSLYGSHPAGHHATNLVLHAANVVLLFLVLTRMTGSWQPSAFVAALFAVHPLRVESVAWIAERKDVLSTLFWLLVTLAHVWYARSPSPRRAAVVALLMALGLMAKPMLVTLPFALLLLDVWPLGRAHEGWRRLVVEKLPLFALAAASSVVTYLAQRAGGAVASLDVYPLPVRALNALWSYAAYLGMTVWPRDLAVPYPHSGALLPWWKPGLAAVVVAVITVAAWRARGSRPYLLMGWLWYLGTLVPVIGLVQVGQQALADRYTYVPLIGIFIAVVWAARGLGRPGAVAGAAIVLALAVQTRAQTGVWRDSITLFAHAIAVTSRNTIAHVGLGTALEAEGRRAEARAHYERALQLDGRERIAHNRLAGLLVQEGRLDEAVEHYLKALRSDPADAETLSNLGIALAKQGQLGEAARRFRAALASGPEDPSAVHVNLGNVFLLSGNTAGAVEQYREALRLNPDDTETRESLRAAERMLAAGAR